MPSRRIPSLALLASVALSGVATSLAHAQQPAELPLPVAPRRPHTTNIHGRTLSDDYFWLRQKGDSGVLLGGGDADGRSGQHAAGPVQGGRFAR